MPNDYVNNLQNIPRIRPFLTSVTDLTLIQPMLFLAWIILIVPYTGFPAYPIPLKSLYNKLPE